MMGVRMTTRSLHEEIKRGLTVEEVLTKYEFASESELIEAVKRMVQKEKGAMDLINSLRQNSKKKRRRRNPDSKEPQDTQSETEYEPQNEPRKFQEGGEYEDGEHEKDADADASTLSLQTLMEEEKEISALLCTLETKHKQVVAAKKQTLEELRNVKNRSERLMEEISCLQREAESLQTEYTNQVIEMRGLSGEIGATQEILMEIREKMEELRKVSIFVYDGGKIEIEGGTEPEVSDEDVSKTFTSLIGQEDADDFTIKELKSIARLVWMVKKMHEEGLKLEIIFEKPSAQELYKVASST